MEPQEKKTYQLKHIVIAVFLTFVVAAGATHFISQELYSPFIDEARQEGYDEGYEVGYDEGRDIGYDEGYDEGYEYVKDIALDYFEGQNSNSDVKSTNNAPEGTVFVTPSGEKYHRNGCQYISGKYNLTGYDSAADAAAAGYKPCSVCNPY